MATIVQKYPMLGSSVDPTKVSLTVKGVLVAITPAVVVVAGLLKVDIGPAQWQHFVELAWQLANQIIGIVGLAMTIVGLARKAWVNYKYR